MGLTKNHINRSVLFGRGHAFMELCAYRRIPVKSKGWIEGRGIEVANMAHKTKRGSLLAVLTSLALSLSLAMTPVYAVGDGVFSSGGETASVLGGLEALEDTGVNVDVTSITKPTEVFQGDDSCGVTFSLKLAKTNIGDTFKAGETIEIATNIGTLFDASWSDFSNIEIRGSDGVLLATASLAADKIVVVVAQGAEGFSEIDAQVQSVDRLTAKDVGATKDKPVVRQLAIGNATHDVTFKYKEPAGPVDPSVKNPVDIAVSWKNAWSIEKHTGATASIEINPIGSMDLYGSYTWPNGTNPNNKNGVTSYDNFLVKDVIQEHGYIDTDSIRIYAAIPALAVRDKDALFNDWYKVPAGTSYAARLGTIRYRIDKDSQQDWGQERLTRLVQNAGETYEEFLARITAQGLQWGVYYDADTDTETFLCNFGGIGWGVDQAAKNNGIKYSDYAVDQWGAQLGDKNFWADGGPTAGNIVSYYIEYNAYYPDVVGEKTVSNAVECFNVASGMPTRVSGNTAQFIINNGSAIGTVKKNELGLLLVDEADMTTPIEGASFKVQKKNGDSWVDSGIVATTDADGRLFAGPFPVGEYKLVQTSTASGYTFSNDTYGESGNDKLGKPNQYGEFAITDQDSFGVGTIVTNRRYSPPAPDPEPDPGEKTGSLAVSKTVVGDGGETDRAFEFVLTLDDALVEGTYGDMEFASGVAKFTLKHGERKVALGLPAGVRYTVEETAVEGYEASATNAAGSIGAGSTVEVVFENRKTAEKPEGPTDPDPDNPDNPDNPDEPDGPDEPEVPETPGQPDGPDGPEAPEIPEQPDGPDAPAGEQDSQKTTNTNDAAGSHEAKAKFAKTADGTTPTLVGAIALSCLACAVVTLSAFRKRRRR